MKKGARKKVRLWGPASGGGIKNWRGAVSVPSQAADALRRNLHKWQQDGLIGSYSFQRQGFLGSGGAAIWIGRVRKVNRAVCGAKTRKGSPCKARAVEGKERCRLHGGLSTGAETAEGRARICESNRRRAEARRAGLHHAPTAEAAPAQT